MRQLKPYIVKDLAKKMVFIGGPRQCGKTTLAKEILKDFSYKKSHSGAYFNWDFAPDKQAIRKMQWSDEHQLIIFDELHKYAKWKTFIKGLYDTFHAKHSFLVTGSARLDVYRRGGDSLLGRYHYWRLHPFTLSDLPKGISKQEAFNRLIKVGGFPEPFLDNDETEARRWRQERTDRVLKDDVREIEAIKDIRNLELLVDALKARVGTEIVFSNLASELEVSPNSIKAWINILERMYFVFTVYPFSKNIQRAVKKSPKIYFFDNADVANQDQYGLGPVVENLVACHLLKRLHFLQDSLGYRYELRYLRDKDNREIDFVVLKEGKVEELYEVKFAKTEISKSLIYYSEKLKPKRAVQLVANLKKSYTKGKIELKSIVEEFAEF